MSIERPAGGRRPRLTGATRALLSASMLSSLGNGLTFPLGAIYLVRVRALPLQCASVFFLALAVSGAFTSLALGSAIDKAGPRAFVALGALAEALGLCAFAWAGHWAMVCCAGALIGCGNGLFFTGLTSLLASLESGEDLDRAFSLRYWLINLGNGAGALAGGAAVTWVGEAVLTPMYVLNAATSLALSIILFSIPIASPSDASASRVQASPLRWNSQLLSIVGAHTLLVLFGFAAFEAVVPIAFVSGSRAQVSLAHAIVAASTLAIVIGQGPTSRWSLRRSKTVVLEAQAAVWAAAALVGLAAVGQGGRPLWTLAIVYGILHGLGECLFAAGLQSLVVRVVSRERLGRFNGVLAASYSVSLAAGPALGFALFEHGSPRLFWIAVLASMGLAWVLWSRVDAPGAAEPGLRVES